MKTLLPTQSGWASSLVRPTLSLWQRDMVRFLRERHRVVSALATPVLFWIFLGSGLTGSFSQPGDGSALAGTTYLQFFFPGTISFILLSTAVFSTITVIEDRRAGFLQGVLASPAPRLAIVLGKVLGGAVIATAQAGLFLLLWPWVAHGWDVSMWLAELGPMIGALGVAGLLAVGLTALGLCIAWPMNTTAGFHAVMMVFLMPMWFLSGAVFPLTDKTPWWLGMIVYANPLTYGQTALAGVLRGGQGPVATGPALLVTILLMLAILAMACRWVSRPRADGLA